MDQFSMIAVCVIVFIATITDVRTLKVYNWLTIPALASGMAYHFAIEGFEGFLASLFSASVVLAILLVPFLLGAVGAGDLKLVAAMAAWLGTSIAFSIAALGLFATGIYSLAILMRQKRIKDAWIHFQLSLVRLQMVARYLGAVEGYQSVHEMAASPSERARLVPFSAMLALGTAVAIVWLNYFA